MWHQGFNRKFYEAMWIIFVRKQNKNNNVVQLTQTAYSVFSGYSPKWCQVDAEEMNCWKKSLFLFSLHTKSILVAKYNYGWTPYVTWIILPISLLCLWTLIVLILLLSMEGQSALRMHKKYLHLCSKDEWRSYGFGTTRGWVINVINFHFGVE